LCTVLEKEAQLNEWRLEVELISAAALAQYMDYRDMSVRKLADLCGVSSATIGHLRAGIRKNCKPETSKKIERHLQAPPGSLFVPKVSRVPRYGAKVAA
jgi:DNA-binding Xre family transcriptional regulator